MKRLIDSSKYIVKNYYIILILYFSFFMANGGMEYNIPFIFESRGMSDSLYGIFLSIMNFLEVILPLTIVYLNRKYLSVSINNISLSFGIIAAFVICLTRKNVFIFVGLIVLCTIRTIFNFSIGNEINLAIPSKIRSEYFAVRDIFLYGAIAISTYISSLIIRRTSLEHVYGILSISLIITIVCSFKAKKIIGKEIDEDTKISVKDYLAQLQIIMKDKIFLVLLLIQVASIIYSVALKFVPLLALKKGISVSVFLKYTALFTIINSVGSLVLAYSAKGKNRKMVYLFDIAFDVFSAGIFLFSRGHKLFLAGYAVSLLKDMFASISFGYMYDCIERKRLNFRYDRKIPDYFSIAGAP